MLLFNTVYASPTGCLRVTRMANEQAQLSLAYRERSGRAHWEFALDDGCRMVSVRASRKKAQGVFDALIHAIDPERRLGRPQLPSWALLGAAVRARSRLREARVG